MSKPSVFIATPALDGRVWADTAVTVSRLQVALSEHGVPNTWRILGELPYLDTARNKLVRGFLATDATDLLFLDSDVGFPPNVEHFERGLRQTLAMLLAPGVDIVCGATPLKQANEAYPIAQAQNPRRREVAGLIGGLVEVEHGPTGYMRITRRAFQVLREAGSAPHIVDYGPSGGKRGEYDAYFDCPVRGTAKVGEDVEFCRRARAAGLTVWLAPDIEFSHAGPAHWMGNYREWETGVVGGGMGPAAAARKAG